MPIDTSPAESARSLLNGIDYGALIGGPLQAAITAQAMAAKSTWEFIQQVGLNTDADGNRSAINVTFLYQRDGQMVRLVVPILTIVPIPLIIIDEVSIDFTANINASASSTSENTKSEDVGGELTAEGKIGWGPFSLSAKLKASYSSKQSSKATQDSRYSVEYTQNVKVHATQADMPAGLATVLNILSSAATGGTANGELTVSPELVTVDESVTNLTQPGALQMVEIRVRNGIGRDISEKIMVSVPPEFGGCFQFWEYPSGNKISWENNSFTLSTNSQGALALWLTATEKVVPLPPPFPVFTLAATVENTSLEAFLQVAVVRALPAPSLSVVPSPLHLPDGTTEQKITVSGAPPDGGNAEVTVTSNAAPTNLNFPSKITLGGDGKSQPTGISWKATGPHDPETLTFRLGDTKAELQVTQKEVAAMRFPATRQITTSPGLNAIPGRATQTWTIVMQGHEGVGGRQPVTIRFEPAVVAVRHEGMQLGNGDSFSLDDRNMARLEFAAMEGGAASQTEVVLESTSDGAILRKVIPVQID